MTAESVKWSFEEFKVFLLIHASYADLEFSQDEKDAILESVGEDTFESVYSAYRKMGEFKRLDFLLEFKSRFFPDPTGKGVIMNLLKEHFMTDGEESKLETNLYNFLDRLF